VNVSNRIVDYFRKLRFRRKLAAVKEWREWLIRADFRRAQKEEDAREDKKPDAPP
jgi:hypothetical protein